MGIVRDWEGVLEGGVGGSAAAARPLPSSTISEVSKQPATALHLSEVSKQPATVLHLSEVSKPVVTVLHLSEAGSFIGVPRHDQVHRQRFYLLTGLGAAHESEYPPVRLFEMTNLGRWGWCFCGGLEAKHCRVG